jgi:hypothetical protein
MLRSLALSSRLVAPQVASRVVGRRAFTSEQVASLVSEIMAMKES